MADARGNLGKCEVSMSVTLLAAVSTESAVVQLIVAQSKKCTLLHTH